MQFEWKRRLWGSLLSMEAPWRLGAEDEGWQWYVSLVARAPLWTGGSWLRVCEEGLGLWALTWGPPWPLLSCGLCKPIKTNEGAVTLEAHGLGYWPLDYLAMGWQVLFLERTFIHSVRPQMSPFWWGLPWPPYIKFQPNSPPSTLALTNSLLSLYLLPSKHDGIYLPQSTHYRSKGFDPFC